MVPKHHLSDHGFAIAYCMLVSSSVSTQLNTTHNSCSQLLKIGWVVVFQHCTINAIFWTWLRKCYCSCFYEPYTTVGGIFFLVSIQDSKISLGLNSVRHRQKCKFRKKQKASIGETNIGSFQKQPKIFSLLIKC